MKLETYSKLLLVTFVYGSPDKRKCKILWDHLNCIALLVNNPLILVGDFKSILSPNEKRGGRLTSIGCKIFQNFIFHNGLWDLEFKGPQFTWRR
ncbi:reverse transcriptase [Gossypium australe]|uniref:Reverse transcriptase n=1 Tax=Gossypium australe TaxID=47621 RepID=A0A5B6VBS1_9ROSI|nr:reverse transcriptase [Gossypium australe]